MNPDRPKPNNRDYLMTDNIEQALFYFQISQKLIRERIERGEGNKTDKQMLDYLDKHISLLEQFIQEQDSEKKQFLREQIDRLKEESKDLIKAASDIAISIEMKAKKKGKFIGFREVSEGINVAVFQDWKDGSEIFFNKQSLESQLNRLKEQGEPTEELEKAINSWPEKE
jgi:flagellar biosynthesis GTPase FlhF